MKPGGELVVVGATGSAGSRVAKLAMEAGLEPVLYGRRREALEQVVAGGGLEVRVGSLEAGDLDRACKNAAVVVSGVGPYTKLGRPVIEAALRANAHYIDFSGEPRWVDDVATQYSAQAVERGCTLVPSVGLGAAGDLAAQLASTGVPQVETLTVAYQIIGMKPSAATALSTIEILSGGAPRYDGNQVRFGRTGVNVQDLPRGRGAGWPLPDPIVMATVWPDASIEACMQVPLARISATALAGIGAILERPVAAEYARTFLARRLGGSGEHGGSGGRATATAIAKGAGRSASAEVFVEDVYDFTGRAGLAAASALLRGHHDGGLQTWGRVVGDPWLAASALNARVGEITSDTRTVRN